VNAEIKSSLARARGRRIRLGQSTEDSSSSFWTSALEAANPLYIGPPPPPGYQPSTPFGQAALDLYNYDQSADPLSSVETNQFPYLPGTETAQQLSNSIPNWVFTAGAMLGVAIIIAVAVKR
jgi:hypothetical protein